MPLPSSNTVARIGLWSVAALALLVASVPRTPYLLAVRDLLPFAVLLASAVTAGLAWRRHRQRHSGRLEAGLLLAMAAFASAMVLIGTAVFHHQRDQVLAADTMTRRLGMHFIVGYRDLREAETMVTHGLIGGLYLARHNVSGRTQAQIHAELAHLQTLRAQAGLPPLIVAADQEGGSVAHLTPPLAPRPGLASLLDAPAEAGTPPTHAATAADAALASRAFAYGQAQGQELAALGVNLNFGPVVDLQPAGRTALLDTHTRTAERAISGDPRQVATVARAYADGLAHAGVGATFKHFPGLGDVRADTHHFRARLETPVGHLDGHDWQPFRHAAADGHAIMLGHVTVPELDPDLPASLSRRVVQGLLRGQWRHDGLLITDDLNMGAVYWRGLCRSAVQALQAGVDLLLVSYDPEQLYPALYCATQAARAGEIDPAQLDDSLRRIRTALPLRPARAGTQEAANTARAAATVASTSASLWATDTKPASNADGAK